MGQQRNKPDYLQEQEQFWYDNQQNLEGDEGFMQ